MKNWLSSLWNDEAKFAATARGIIFALGELPTLINFGEVGGAAYYVGKALQMAALFVRAGDRTPTGLQLR